MNRPQAPHGLLQVFARRGVRQADESGRIERLAGRDGDLPLAQQGLRAKSADVRNPSGDNSSETSGNR